MTRWHRRIHSLVSSYAHENHELYYTLLKVSQAGAQFHEGVKPYIPSGGN